MPAYKDGHRGANIGLVSTTEIGSSFVAYSFLHVALPIRVRKHSVGMDPCVMGLRPEALISDVFRSLRDKSFIILSIRYDEGRFLLGHVKIRFWTK